MKTELENIPAIISEIRQATVPRKLSVAEFPSRFDYYWAYQYMLAKLYLFPLLEAWEFSFSGARVLDVGCGTAGMACALIDRGAICTGVDIDDLKKPNLGGRPFRFVQGDMCDRAILARLDRDYALALVRDVIEHIEDKKTFLQNILETLAPGGKMFITFPPYYSPFGGHLQITQSGAGFVPYVHLLPRALFRKVVGVVPGSERLKQEVLRLNEIRTSIRQVENVLAELPVKILRRRYYALRPTFHIRYGVKPRRAFWGRVPLLRELTVSAAFYYVEKR